MTVSDVTTPLPVGTPAPDFELFSAPDKTVSLADLRGRAVILAFYPADWIPVCSDEMALYQAVLPEFQRFGAELLGHLRRRRLEPPRLRKGSSLVPPAGGLRTKGAVAAPITSIKLTTGRASGPCT